MERKKSNQEDTGFGEPNGEAGWEEVQAVHWATAEGAGAWSALRKKTDLFKQTK